MTFSNTVYTGTFSASGSGYDAGQLYTITASGSLSATLSESADGSITGSWSYSGTASYSGGGAEGVSGSGQVSGTASHLSFTSDGLVFVNATGSLSGNDTSIHLTAGLSSVLGSGSASGDMSGSPVIVPDTTGPAEVVSVPTAVAWTSTSSGSGEMTFVSPQFDYDASTGAWSLASMPAPGSYTGSDVSWMQGSTQASHDDYISKAFSWAAMAAQYAGLPSSVQQFLSSASNAATIYDAEASFAKRLLTLLPSVPAAIATDAGNEAIQAELEAGSTALRTTITNAANDSIVGSIAEKDAAASTMWNAFGAIKAVVSNSTQFYTFMADEQAFYGGSHRDTMLGSSSGDLFWGGANDDAAFGWSGNDSLHGDAGVDALSGGAGNDLLEGGAGDDTLVGGVGIDQAQFAGNRAGYAVARTASGYSVQDNVGTDGTDALSGVERLLFADIKLAFDTDGPAGNAAKFIGAAFGTQYMTSDWNALKGAVVSYFDAGITMQQLAAAVVALPIYADLAGSHSNLDVARYIFRNVVGQEASAETAAALAQYMDAGMSQGDFLAAIANLDLNASHVGLVGLSSTGLEYV